MARCKVKRRDWKDEAWVWEAVLAAKTRGLGLGNKVRDEV